MKRLIRYGLHNVDTWGPKRVRIRLNKLMPIETHFDGVNWFATACGGVIKGDTEIFDDKTEARAIWDLRQEIGGLVGRDHFMYARNDFTEKGMRSFERERDALMPFLPENKWPFAAVIEEKYGYKSKRLDNPKTG